MYPQRQRVYRGAYYFKTVRGDCELVERYLCSSLMEAASVWFICLGGLHLEGTAHQLPEERNLSVLPFEGSCLHTTCIWMSTILVVLGSGLQGIHPE